MAVQKEDKQIQVRPIHRLKMVLSAQSVREQFQNALKENAGAFIASIIDLYNSDSYLQQCDPNLVVMEALKAATLKLPINKQLGFAYIVPYRNNKGQMIPQFQLGYKGYIQLAMRTGQYKNLNAGVVYEGIKVHRDILTGEVVFTGEPTSDKPQGYFAYMELINGFKKTVYMTHAEVVAHAKRYSKSFNSANSAWQTNFEEMALKTVLRRLLSKYGILSTEMVTALTSDRDEDIENEVAAEIEENANKEVIDIKPEEVKDIGEIEEVEDKTDNEPEQIVLEGPGF
ncbi:recombinase RecT [Thermoanaerobacterium thermosaccharolyticum]|uniref:recombinase RecT n=1 Tax=Thermoanaerobacterium thermosaccharolyticum TaxID=1517 RepID=UPI003D2C4313